uniref:Alcohol dehydrogenase-like C-terminal domain-containing protein n=1 Tax=Electrophorus electricus TaxID=8005 RepID=A0A4W4H6T0_ELEEL
MGCKNAGASRIIAKIFGATDFVNPKSHKKPISEVLCVGNGAVMRSALESCVKGWGVSVLVGWTDVQDFSARPIQLISGKTWKGSLFGGFKSKDSVPKLVLDYMAGRIMLDEFVTHTMSLDQVNHAVQLMKTGGCIRTIINPSK